MVSNYIPVKETANKLRAWREMKKATHRKANESRKSGVRVSPWANQAFPSVNHY